MENEARKAAETVSAVLKKLAAEWGLETADPADPVPGTPPQEDMGDVAFPMFVYAKQLRKSPVEIARAVASAVAADAGYRAVAAGPYVNLFYNLAELAQRATASADDAAFGTVADRKGQKIMIEFSCPNTNKPLHLGHMRNDSLGESVSRILKAAGADICKVNLINDRGVHICKSMLAYKEFGKGMTPEEAGVKSDRFVGDYYVKFDQWSKTDPTAMERVRRMLVDWENGDEEVRALWKQMNGWAVSGIKETYRRTDVSFDRFYFESETYLKGKNDILRGLEEGLFYKESDGSVWVDLAEIGLDKKVLLRADGTSLYITQDLGTAVSRHGDWPFDRLIYVVASEQQYHFKVLFYVLRKLGYEWAENLFHLSYGMVNLPEGKMKSREGTVVDADDLLNELALMAKTEMESKEKSSGVEDVNETAEKIALGALNYFLLSKSPTKDMIFNPKESLSFNGETGPYLQYTATRITSILAKYEERKGEFEGIPFCPEKLSSDEERKLIKMILSYPDQVSKASAEMNPSVLTAYLYDLAKTFSQFYHDYPILNCDDKETALARLKLVRSVLEVMKKAFYLVGIPYLKKM